jgi:hypothetical protein
MLTKKKTHFENDRWTETPPPPVENDSLERFDRMHRPKKTPRALRAELWLSGFLVRLALRDVGRPARRRPPGRPPGRNRCAEGSGHSPPLPVENKNLKGPTDAPPALGSPASSPESIPLKGSFNAPA